MPPKTLGEIEKAAPQPPVLDDDEPRSLATETSADDVPVPNPAGNVPLTLPAAVPESTSGAWFGGWVRQAKHLASLAGSRAAQNTGFLIPFNEIIPGLLLGVIPSERNALTDGVMGLLGRDTEPESKKIARYCDNDTGKDGAKKERRPLKFVAAIHENFEASGLVSTLAGKESWNALGVNCKQIESRDRRLTCTLEEMHQLVEGIHNARDTEKGSAYVHCRQGKGRSYTVVLAYLTTAFRVPPQGVHTGIDVKTLPFDEHGRCKLGQGHDHQGEIFLHRAQAGYYVNDLTIPTDPKPRYPVQLDTNGQIIIGTPGQVLNIAEARLLCSLKRNVVGLHPEQSLFLQSYRQKYQSFFEEMHLKAQAQQAAAAAVRVKSALELTERPEVKAAMAAVVQKKPAATPDATEKANDLVKAATPEHRVEPNAGTVQQFPSAPASPVAPGWGNRIAEIQQDRQAAGEDKVAEMRVLAAEAAVRSGGEAKRATPRA